MTLYNNKQPLRNLKIMDIQGQADRTMPAQDVFAAAIHALRKDALEELKKNGTTVSENEIRWVLTVPAIWPDDAKIFMRESAKKAGIASDRLLIALEPEVASVYCQFQNVESNDSNIIAPGTKYIVADVGGGTTDITAHEKLKEGKKLKELCKASGEGCGGKSVDDAFFELLDDLFGKELMLRLKKEKPKPYLTLRRNFQNIKHSVRSDIADSKFVEFPVQSMKSLIDKEFEKMLKMKNINIKNGKLELSAQMIKALFQPTVDKILSNIDCAIKKVGEKEISLIMLVGGFANSEYIQNAVKKRFQDKRIIVKSDAALAVLRGAVLYGHQPETIDPRVTRFAYGVELNEPFDKNKHESTRMIFGTHNRVFCRGVFSLIIKQNTFVQPGTIVKRTYTVPSFSPEICLPFYASETDDILYTDDRQCRHIGTLTISIPIPSEDERYIDVEYIFGNTEINVRATEKGYGKTVSSNITIQ